VEAKNQIIDRALPSSNFWYGKKVLVTGHTGFKGSWLCLWLHRMGARVVGVSLPPQTIPNLYSLALIDTLITNYYCDICDVKKLVKLITDEAPDIVLHLAAQSLVRPGYQDPIGTFNTNFMGTAHVLEAVRSMQSVRSVVCVTTDKVYRNLEHLYPYRESDTLGGYDPYSASKAASEILINSYRDSFFNEKKISVASARAGNVIGGGDWAEDRLIPDAVRAWGQDEQLVIRSPLAIRPWQHVLEPLNGYLVLAERLWQQPDIAGAYNFGPETQDAATVEKVASLARSAFGKGNLSIEGNQQGPHEAGWLSLEIAKSRNELGVKPYWSLHETVIRTMEWYRRQMTGDDARHLCDMDIEAYEGKS